MDHPLIADDQARMPRMDARLKVNNLNADALRNADDLKLGHRLRADRRRKLNVVVAAAESSNQRHKANV